MSAIVIPDFISSQEQVYLNEHAQTLRKTGALISNMEGPHRFALNIWNTQYLDATVTKVADRVIETFGLQDVRIDPYLGWVISFIEPKGFVHPHLDKYPLYLQSTYRHFRCNVLVTRPDDTANPIIDEQIIDVPECGLWAFFASELKHGTQVVQGDQARVVYQFGFALPGEFDLKINS